MKLLDKILEVGGNEAVENFLEALIEEEGNNKKFMAHALTDGSITLGETILWYNTKQGGDYWLKLNAKIERRFPCAGKLD